LRTTCVLGYKIRGGSNRIRMLAERSMIAPPGKKSPVLRSQKHCNALYAGDMQAGQTASRDGIDLRTT